MMPCMREALGEQFVVEAKWVPAVNWAGKHHPRLLEALPDRCNPIREST